MIFSELVYVGREMKISQLDIYNAMTLPLNCDFVEVSIALQQVSHSASEGGMVEVCAVISSVPTGGLECPVVATLSATDGKAGK